MTTKYYKYQLTGDVKPQEEWMVIIGYHIYFFYLEFESKFSSLVEAAESYLFILCYKMGGFIPCTSDGELVQTN